MNNRVYNYQFNKIYQLYVEKISKKNRTVEELNQVITWLTGYSKEELKALIDSNITLKEFYLNAVNFNENASLITGVVCNIRVEEIKDPLDKKIRYLDKLVDELYKNKSLDKILRK